MSENKLQNQYSDMQFIRRDSLPSSVEDRLPEERVAVPSLQLQPGVLQRLFDLHGQPHGVQHCFAAGVTTVSGRVRDIEPPHQPLGLGVTSPDADRVRDVVRHDRQSASRTEKTQRIHSCHEHTIPPTTAQHTNATNAARPLSPATIGQTTLPTSTTHSPKLQRAGMQPMANPSARPFETAARLQENPCRSGRPILQGIGRIATQRQGSETCIIQLKGSYVPAGLSNRPSQASCIEVRNTVLQGFQNQFHFQFCKEVLAA